jgi:chromosomal replication initiation ATPase DnaA
VSRAQFIKDFISDLEEENIRVYRYDPRNVSFQLVEDPFSSSKKDSIQILEGKSVEFNLRRFTSVRSSIYKV